MKNLKDRVIQKDSSKIISKTIDNDVILIPLEEKDDEDYLYTLSDPVSMRIWELIDGKRNVGGIADILYNEFEVERKQIEEDLINFLKELGDTGIIQYKQENR